jgi:DNA (cytosine-5)-methyltransferase 1
MKYLDLFSGYGGFSLGIQQAYEELNKNSNDTGKRQESSEQQGISVSGDSRGVYWKELSTDGKCPHSIQKRPYQFFKQGTKLDGTIDEVEQRRCGQEESELETTMPLPVSEPLLGQYPTCVGFSEIDKYAIQIYEKHFGNQQSTEIKQDRERGNGTINKEKSNVLPTSGTTTLGNEIKGHKNYGDIKTINPAELPDFDLLCGGFPCQAFSIAGKRAGFEDTRGTLIYDVFRIIKEKHPKLVLLENVKGLLSHDNGRTFKTIITSLAELGYAVEWQVLNAKNFGVPQNRERVFIIGHLGGFGGRQIFPIRENDKLFAKRQGKISPTITSGYYKQGQSDPYIVTEKSESSEQGLFQERIESNNTDSRGGQTHPTDFRIRRLTPKECERLMGLPDSWTEGVSDTQRYKLCGNGVVVNVVKEIIISLVNK